MKIIQTKLIFGIILFFSILLIHNNVNAVGLQANKGGTARKARFIDQFERIRQMETSGGTLGKEAEIDTSTYAETGTGNGIDCHMVKNTEWGAVAILGISEYGTGNSNDETSTGNNGTGVFQMAGSATDSPSSFVSGMYRVTVGRKVGS